MSSSDAGFDSSSDPETTETEVEYDLEVEVMSNASKQKDTSDARGRGGGGTWVNFCWVCAAGLSEPLPHYSLFRGQVETPS